MNQSRRNQVGKFAEELAKECTDNMELHLVVMSIVFKAVEWADSNPAWVSVEDELPKITIDGWRSEDVFFATDDGKSHFGFYSNKGVWFSSVYGFNGHQVTNWMPLPTPPAKKGGEE